MHMLRTTSFPIEQVTDLNGTERRFGDWFAGSDYPKRFLAFSRPFDMRPAMTRLIRDSRDLDVVASAADPLLIAIDGFLAGSGIDPSAALADMHTEQAALLLDLFADASLAQAALAQGSQQQELWISIADSLAGVLWRRPWMKEQLRFYERLGQMQLRSATYLMLTWEPADVSGAAIAQTLSATTGRPVIPIEQLPPILASTYLERHTHLEAETPGHPYLAVLISYEARGVWDATTLHQLMNQSFDVAIAVDIESMSRNKAQRMAEFSYNAARLAARDQQLVDVRAQRVQGDAELVMHELTRQSLHLVQIAILIAGETLEDLNRNMAVMQGMLGMQVRFLRADGFHAEALKLWTTQSAKQIDIPWKRRVMLSHGVGCVFGLIGFHRTGNTNGFLWGMDSMRQAALFVDLFANNRAGHTMILGMTGFGKTVFLNVLALRGAVEANYRVIGIDAFNNGDRVQVAAGAGARCAHLGMESQINLLDIVYDEETEGGWVSSQIQHVIGELSLLLGVPGKASDGKERLLPREFTVAERGVLDRALLHIYANCTPNMSLHQTPTLGHLIVQLEAFREAEAQQLARDMRMLFFGTDDRNETVPTSIGQAFNTTTAIDWDFSHDINYYDLAHVPAIWRPFFYAHLIGAVLRDMRDPTRDRTRKTLLQIDEFGYLMQVEALAQLAATICKVARKFGYALVVVDQNPDTFYNSAVGRQIVENIGTKVLFRLDAHPARQMGTYIPDLTPLHVEFLSRAERGQAVLVLNNDVYVMNVQLTPREERVLKGS